MRSGAQEWGLVFIRFWANTGYKNSITSASSNGDTVTRKSVQCHLNRKSQCCCSPNGLPPSSRRGDGQTDSVLGMCNHGFDPLSLLGSIAMTNGQNVVLV